MQKSYFSEFRRRGPDCDNIEMLNLAPATAKVMEILVFVGVAFFFSLFFWTAAKLNKERGL